LCSPGGEIRRSGGRPAHGLPAADLRLVAPESRYEIHDGKIEYVPPFDEPHGTRHSKLSALLEAHVADAWDVASDMLTRTSEIDDIVPDASVFPREREPESGGRKLEELAFQVVSTEQLGKAAAKAKKLADRGVRRVFAVDVSRQRAFEWSAALESWELLVPSGTIEDETLGAPLTVEALVRAAKADDAIAHALLRKKNPVLESALLAERDRGKVEGKAEGKAEAVVAILEARGIALAEADRARILATTDAETVNAWIARAATSASAAEVLSDHWTKRRRSTCKCVACRRERHRHNRAVQ
jgi:Uma2 family endonuclease